MGVPVGARFNLDLALGEGRYDVVHGIEPGLPSLSYLALRDAQTLAVASFFSPERLSYPPGKAQRERLLNRTDALLATTEGTAAAAGERFPGDYRVVSEGVDVERFSPAPKRNVIAIEWRPSARPVARAVLRALRDLPGWEVVFVRTRSMFGRPFVPRAVLDRVRIETLRSGESRAELLNTSAIFVPAPQGLNRLRLEAAAAGNAIVDPPGVGEQPELAAAAVARLTEDAEHREREGSQGASLGRAAELPGRGRRAGGALRGARRPGVARLPGRTTRSRTAPGSWPTCTCTRAGRTTARSRSPSCSTTRRRPASARSRSRITTSSAARSRRSSRRAAASWS